MAAYDHCVGLAAPSSASPARLVMDVSGHPKARSCHGLVVLFDPEVLVAGPVAIARERLYECA
jgi:peptide deformylase